MKSLLFFVTRGLRAVSLVLVLAAVEYAQVVTTTAGGFVGDGGLAVNAGMNYPRYMLQDSSGNTYIADSFNHRIRKVDTTGKIRTFAGTGISGFSGDGGAARNAMLSFPTGLLFDTGGNMLVSDSNNNRIRKITPTGIISTIAGTGTPGYSGDGGPALQAQLNSPWGLSLDKAGNIFFTDVLNSAVRKIDIATGIITTVAGTGTAGYNGDGIPATQADLNLPRTVIVDSDGNLYIADTQNHRVRLVN